MGKTVRFFIFIIVICAIFSCKPSEESAKPVEDKAGKIAQWIQEKVNTEGYTGCITRVIERGDPGIVQCDFHFPPGTDPIDVRFTTKKGAEFFAQVGRLAATIYYTGYSGSQAVCEYQYDCYTGRIKEKY